MTQIPDRILNTAARFNDPRIDHDVRMKGYHEITHLVWVDLSGAHRWVVDSAIHAILNALEDHK